jgi:hypothetical protein
MTADIQTIGQIGAAAAVLLTAVLQLRRWRDAKARGLSPAQLIVASGGSAQKLRATGKHMRWTAWAFVASPFVLAALSLIHHQYSGAMLAVETAALEVMFGGLALICLWIARLNETRARETEMLLAELGRRADEPMIGR